MSIKVYLQENQKDYSYDLYALLRAFFPLTEVEFVENETFCDSADSLSLVITGQQMTLQTIAGDLLKSQGPATYTMQTDGAAEPQTFKKEAKGYFYDFLSEMTGKTLPWGNLTGIRPTKLIRQTMEDGKDTKALQAFHRISDRKMQLGSEIATREMQLLNSLHGIDGYSVYIGIPFCPTRCLYCSFTSNPIAKCKHLMPAYLDCLTKELEATAELMKDKKLDSVYIGGGTPTTLEPEEFERLLGDICRILPVWDGMEFTVESGRPDSITREKLETLKKYPVTRISVNPQTMKAETLKIIGRQHTIEQLKEAFQMAREVGFDNINMDIILGLPGENEEDVAYTISEIEKMQPDSLTVHSLAVKRASALKPWLAEHGHEVTMDYEKAMAITAEGAARMDLKPYYLYRQKDMSGNLENTGYAKEGKYGIYNILIMEEVQSIVALGAGSVTKRVYENGRIERCDNVKDVALYIEKIDEMIERKRVLFGE